MTGLFTSIKLGPYELPNRIVMAPMTRCRIDADGVPADMNATYYAQRASAGLIISEACAISAQGVGYANTPGIYNEAQVEGWRKVTQRVHNKGSRIFLQLWHVGRISHPSLQPDGNLPVAPSAIRPAGKAFTYDGPLPFVIPRALRTEEIAGIVADYRDAAKKALDAGFDGVEIHAANGYLIDQFLRSSTNQREDAYGGSVKNRIRFLSEVVSAISEACGTARVGVRLSPENHFNDIFDDAPQTLFENVIDHLNSLGLAYVHIVEGVIHSSGKIKKTFNYGKLRARYQGQYMANNGYGKKRAEAALSTGSADLISFGTPFIANPDLPNRLAQNLPLNKMDESTFYVGGVNGYITY
ncbi:MAG TPA: alkene reductase [Gammaproteobacteria bacterium]|nr:alkene reductase [Gammaproteobacteria bacterium]